MVRAFVVLILFASQAFAGAMRGDEAAAVAVAVERFKSLYGKPDLRHYSVEYARRGKELDVIFIADEPKKHSEPNYARTGGGSIYGPDIRYVVSLTTLKMLRFNFYR
jgi:hypothetical protein